MISFGSTVITGEGELEVLPGEAIPISARVA
jgi:hypothetical protein